MELWDILDANGNKTGGIIERGKKLGPGEYHLAVHVYIYNEKNEFIIQKRSIKKDLWPGKWDITGGSVIAGEDSLTGAAREVEEELGIMIPAEKLTFIKRLQRGDCFIDVWFASTNVSIQDVVMQDVEVDDVKFVSAEEMIDVIFFIGDEEYKELIKTVVKNTVQISNI